MGRVSKTELRKWILTYKRLLDEEEYAKRNNLLLHQFDFFIESFSPERVHIFLPIERNREPNTFQFIQSLLQRKIHILVSSTDFTKKKMTHFRYEETLEIKKNHLGIPEPVSGDIEEDLNVDTVFLPLLTSDKQGNRIGYGGGYYDRLLEGKDRLRKVGISIGPLLDHLPITEDHDIKLNYSITPWEIVEHQ